MALFTNPDRKPEPVPARKSGLRRTLRFMFNPEFGRSAAPIGQTFQMFVQMLALLFVSNGTLEKTHPFFGPGARFTIGDLFRETHARIDWHNRDKLPQTVFFCAVWGLLTSAVLYLVTFILLFVAAPGQAHAADASGTATSSSGSMFSVEDSSSDLGLRFLDYMVLGKPLPTDPNQLNDNSVTEGGINAGLIQTALRAMLKVYSSAILILASFMLLYHIVMLIAKSAWSGKPLEGANHIWAPLRLVIAIGLLVPVSNGINSGQYAVLKIAAVGSSLASNVWGQFSSALHAAQTQSPQLSRSDVAQQFYDMILINICKYDINDQVGHFSALGILEGAGAGGVAGGVTGAVAGAIYGGLGELDKVYPHAGNLDNYNNVCKIGPHLNQDLCGTIKLPKAYGASGVTGYLATSACYNGKPICDPNGDASIDCGIPNAAAEETTQQGLMSLNTDEAKLAFSIRDKATKPSLELYKASDSIAKKIVEWYANYNVGEAPASGLDQSSLAQEAGDALKKYYESIDTVYTQTIPAEVTKYKSAIATQMDGNKQGWIMAGAHFMRIASMQTAIASAVDVSPSAERGEIFTRISDQRRDDNKVDNASKNSDHERFLQQLENPKGYAQAVKSLILCGVGAYNCGGSSQPQLSSKYRSLVSDIKIAKAAKSQPTDSTAPSGILAAISGWVSVDKTQFIRYVTPNISDPFGALFAVGHFVYGIGLLMMVPGLLIPGGALLFSIGIWAVTTSIFLVFILPMVPMMKFLTATMGWLFGVFEALVGMPLFALAHLTPGGDGLLDPVRKGYQMLLHIALQPVFLIFGLIGAIVMASLGLYAMNAMYLAALNAVWGSGDVFILTAVGFMAIYCINAYTICNICFRFIDDIGQRSMAWFGGESYNFKDVDAHQSRADMLLLSGFAKGTVGAAEGGAKAIRGMTGGRVAGALSPPKKPDAKGDPAAGIGSGGGGGGDGPDGKPEDDSGPDKPKPPGLGGGSGRFALGAPNLSGQDFGGNLGSLRSRLPEAEKTPGAKMPGGAKPGLAQRIAQVSPRAGSALRGAQLQMNDMKATAAAGMSAAAGVIGGAFAGIATVTGARKVASIAGRLPGRLDEGLRGSREARANNAQVRQEMAAAGSTQERNDLKHGLQETNSLAQRAGGKIAQVSRGLFKGRQEGTDNGSSAAFGAMYGTEIKMPANEEAGGFRGTVAAGGVDHASAGDITGRAETAGIHGVPNENISASQAVTDILNPANSQSPVYVSTPVKPASPRDAAAALTGNYTKAGPDTSVKQPAVPVGDKPAQRQGPVVDQPTGFTERGKPPEEPKS